MAIILANTLFGPVSLRPSHAITAMFGRQFQGSLLPNCNPGKNYVDSKQCELLHKSFQSIRSPPLPLFNVVRRKMCFDNNTMKLSLYVQHWTGGAGENSCFLTKFTWTRILIKMRARCPQ